MWLLQNKVRRILQNLDAGPIYATLMSLRDNAPCPFYKFVWVNHAPPWVRFFTWLLVQNIMQCKTNLLAKHIVEDSVCEVWRDGAESPDHLILHCPIASQFWVQNWHYSASSVRDTTLVTQEAITGTRSALTNLPTALRLANMEAQTRCGLQKPRTVSPTIAPELQSRS